MLCPMGKRKEFTGLKGRMMVADLFHGLVGPKTPLEAPSIPWLLPAGRDRPNRACTE